MWVRIGPVPAASARAWLRSAAHNIEKLSHDEWVRAEVDVPSGVTDGFRRFLDVWTEAAESDPFDWAAEVDVEESSRLALWWFNVAGFVRERGEQFGLMRAPVEAEPFYDSLVAAMAEVVAAADTAHTNADRLADKFAEVVPRFDAVGNGGAAGRQPGQPIRVLVVDDTEDIRLLLRFALDHDERFVVVGEAGTGEDAVDHCRNDCPDVVLLDCMLPGMSGLDALPVIREACPRTKIVMTSASDEFRQPAEAWGVPFLSKTATMAEIAATLHSVA